MDAVATQKERINATVGILTFNSGKVLRRALESVSDFDDILLCDGGSTDDTLEIARAFGARVIPQDAKFKNPNGTLKNFGGVRQQLLESAKYDWFLYIDSDETISEGLRTEIQDIVIDKNGADDPLVYRVPYGIMMDGRPLRYASNFPGYQYRFFNRKSGAHFIKEVHERISFDETQIRIGTVKNPWYTYARRADAWNYLRDTRGYRELQARASRSISFDTYIKFIVWRCLRASVGAFGKTMRNYLLHGFKDSAPIGDEFGRIMSPLLLIGDITRELVLHRERSTLGNPFWKIMCWNLFPTYFISKTFRNIDHPTKKDMASRHVEAELLILPKLLALNPKGMFLDIGANIGSYVYVASRHISQKNSIAFEPQQAYAERLRALFPRIVVETIALSSKPGEAEFKIPEIRGVPYPTRGTLEHFTEEGESSAQYQKVSLMPLDAYVAKHKITSLSVIKIDVEGHEYSVLEGARTTLQTLQPILIVEIEQRHYEESVEKIFSYLKDLGYEGWFYDLAENTFAPLSEFTVETRQRMADFKTAQYINNFIFLPKGTEIPSIDFMPLQ